MKVFFPQPPGRRQPRSPVDPFDDPREAPTSEAPPKGWSTAMPVRRQGRPPAA